MPPRASQHLLDVVRGLLQPQQGHVLEPAFRVQAPEQVVRHSLLGAATGGVVVAAGMLDGWRYDVCQPQPEERLQVRIRGVGGRRQPGGVDEEARGLRGEPVALEPSRLQARARRVGNVNTQT